MSSLLLMPQDVAAARRRLAETTFPYSVCYTLTNALNTIDALRAENERLCGLLERARKCLSYRDTMYENDEALLPAIDATLGEGKANVVP